MYLNKWVNYNMSTIYKCFSVVNQLTFVTSKPSDFALDKIELILKKHFFPVRYFAKFDLTFRLLYANIMQIKTEC